MQALTSRDISAVLALVTRQRGLGRGRGPGTQQHKVPWDKEASWFQEDIRACVEGKECKCFLPGGHMVSRYLYPGKFDCKVTFEL